MHSTQFKLNILTNIYRLTSGAFNTILSNTKINHDNITGCDSSTNFIELLTQLIVKVFYYKV